MDALLGLSNYRADYNDTRKNADDTDSQGTTVAVVTATTNSSKPRTAVKETKDVGPKVTATLRLKERCRRAQNNEDYLNFVGDIMYPKRNFGPYGFHADALRFPIERVTSLGYLLSALRRPTVMEKWSPFEVSVFEASITLNGKNFSRIQKHVQTKTVQDVIEFYYDWKKTSHYRQWKKNYVPDERDVPTVKGD